MECDYIDRAIIKLKREYGKDEIVASLIKQLKEKDVLIGELKSEIDYLNNELQSDKEKKEINRLAKIEARKEELYRLKTQEVKKSREEIKQLRHLRNDLIAKLNINQ